MGKLLVSLLIVLILVGFLVARVNNLDLKTDEDRIKFVAEYGNWLYKSVLNIKEVVGFVVKQDWSIAEETKKE